MSVSILEALQNADYNLSEGKGLAPIEAIGKRQLHNAVVLLLKDYPLSEHVEPLLEQYGTVENVPINQVG